MFQLVEVVREKNDGWKEGWVVVPSETETDRVVFVAGFEDHGVDFWRERVEERECLHC